MSHNYKSDEFPKREKCQSLGKKCILSASELLQSSPVLVKNRKLTTFLISTHTD